MIERLERLDRLYIISFFSVYTPFRALTKKLKWICPIRTPYPPTILLRQPHTNTHNKMGNAIMRMFLTTDLGLSSAPFVTPSSKPLYVLDHVPHYKLTERLARNRMSAHSTHNAPLTADDISATKYGLAAHLRALGA